MRRRSTNKSETTDSNGENVAMYGCTAVRLYGVRSMVDAINQHYSHIPYLFPIIGQYVIHHRTVLMSRKPTNEEKLKSDRP